MPSIRRKLSAKSDKWGRSEIILTVTATRDNRINVKSGVRVLADHFRDGEIRPPSKGEERLAAKDALVMLDQIERVLFEAAEDPFVTREELEAAVAECHGRAAAKPDGERLLGCFERYVMSRRAEMADFTLVSYGTAKGILSAYCAKQKREVTVASFKASDAEAVVKGLRDGSLTRNGRPLADSSIGTLVCRMKTFFKWARAEKLTEHDPFGGIQLRAATYGTPYFLTIEERDALAAAEMPSEEVAEARDCFIVQCCLGCRYSDLRRLTPDNISEGMLTYVPVKTSHKNARAVRVPVNRLAASIIARLSQEGRLLPVPSFNKRYNVLLREACRAAGLRRMVAVTDPHTHLETVRPICEVASSHMARRTFIGNLYAKVKDPNLIGAMSGHVEGSQAFARYRSIDDDMKREVMSLLGDL